MMTLCELSFVDGTHVPFNAGLLATIDEAFPKEELVFYATATHIAELKQQVGERLSRSIVWRDIVPPTPGTAYLKRFSRELSIIRRVFKSLPREQTSRLILTSAYPSTILGLKIARWYGFRQIRVQIVLHGMSGVVGKRYRRPIRRFQDTRTALTLLGNGGIQYVVLEESIRSTVLYNVPALRPHIRLLEHPICPHEGVAQITEFSWPIRFGFLGLALKSKGFPLFLDIAQAVRPRYAGHAEFHAIGRLPDGQSVKGLEVLATRPASSQLSRAQFLSAVSELHFIVLPHDPEFYSLSASGVLLDAIAFQKPVIARRMPIFEAMFGKHGDIGYLFKDAVELQKVIEQILQETDRSRYRQQVLNLKNLRESRAPEALATAYRDLCSTHVGG
jgi:glycosyltransferase involved in cell wall biosynthesis